MHMNHFFSHIFKDFKKNAFDYLLLITAGVFFIIGLNIFKGERLLEFIFLIIFTSFYIIWGIYHHINDKTIHIKVVLEYVLIGFIVIFLLKALIFT